MKKLLSLLLVLALLVPVSANAAKLSEMSFDELVALREKIAIELTKRPEWKEVTVPQGVWKVGEDIPAGHWTISAADSASSMITIGTALDASGFGIDTRKSELYFWRRLRNPNYIYFDAVSDISSIDFELKSGYYVIVEDGAVVFTPYIGKPTLGF